MSGTILIVDDDQAIRRMIAIYLKNEGLGTLEAETAMEALHLLESHTVDLIILDVMLPEMDGIEACMAIREKENMPIIMVSAKSEDLDKIQGLTSGADDYLTKPFNPLELLARVKSHLRRYRTYNPNPQSDPAVIEIGDMVIDTGTRMVQVAGRDVRLTPKEFDILALLARHKGTVLSIQKIYESVWQQDFYKSDNNVMVHITKIRDKIEDDPKKPVYIKTIWGVGYKI